MSLTDNNFEDVAPLACSWFNKGYVLSMEGKYQEALAAYDMAIRIEPKFAYPWNGRGYMLAAQGNHQEALDAYDKAIELNPEFAYPQNGRGNVLIILERYEEALTAYNKAIEIEPEFAYPWNGKAMVLAQNADLESKEGYSARQSLCKAVYLLQTYVQGFPILMSELVESSEKNGLPLLAYEVLAGSGEKASNQEYKDLLEKAQKRCEEFLGVLSFIETDSGLSDGEKLLCTGIVHYCYGSPIKAYKYLDNLDSKDEGNLLGQYYLILSRKAYLEPVEREIAFAVKQAEKVIASDPAENQYYYAGLIFMLADNAERAEFCFSRTNDDTPSVTIHNTRIYIGSTEAEDVLRKIRNLDNVL